LQNNLELRTCLLEAFYEGSRATVKEFLDGGLSHRTQCFHGARTPGELRLTATARGNRLSVKLTPRRQVRHSIRRRPARTIGRTMPVALWPATPGLSHTDSLVPHDRDVRELITDIKGHTSSPSRHTSTASSTSKTVGCCTGVHKA